MASRTGLPQLQDRRGGEEYRELELARLDALQAAHWPQAVAGSVRSADLVLRVIDRRIKLLGLDQPRMEDDRPRYLVVSAADDDEAGYIRQLQAITAMSDEPSQATRKATEPDPHEEQAVSAFDLRARDAGDRQLNQAR